MIFLCTPFHHPSPSIQKPSKLGVESYDCVNNPARHFERTGTWRPECSTITEATFHRHPELNWPSTAFMLSLDTEESEDAYVQRGHFLLNHKFRLQRFPAVNGLKEFGHLYDTRVDLNTNSTIKIYNNPRLRRAVSEGMQGFLTAGEEGLLTRDE